MGTGTSFYATPEEQREWLRLLVHDEQVWCWLCLHRFTQPPQREWIHIRDTTAIDHLTFTVPEKPRELHRFYIGRYEWSEPVWQAIALGSQQVLELDMARSQAILYQPALFRGNTLLPAYFSAAPRWRYAAAGHDPEPVYRWYLSLKRRWHRWRAKEYVLCIPHPEAQLVVDRYSWISVQAVVWYHNGGILWDEFSNTQRQVKPRWEVPKQPSPRALCADRERPCVRCRGTGRVAATDALPNASRLLACPACNGTGCVPKRTRWCRRCNGEGTIRRGDMSAVVVCPACGGKGLAEAGTKWCRACGGTGQLWRPSEESSGALVSQACLFCGGKGVIVAELEEQS